MTAAFHVGERVSFLESDGRKWGTIVLALAGGRLLRIETADGRRVWRTAG